MVTRGKAGKNTTLFPFSVSSLPLEFSVVKVYERCNWQNRNAVCIVPALVIQGRIENSRFEAARKWLNNKQIW